MHFYSLRPPWLFLPARWLLKQRMPTPSYVLAASIVQAAPEREGLSLCVVRPLSAGRYGLMAFACAAALSTACSISFRVLSRNLTVPTDDAAGNDRRWTKRIVAPLAGQGAP